MIQSKRHSQSPCPLSEKPIDNETTYSQPLDRRAHATGRRLCNWTNRPFELVGTSPAVVSSMGSINWFAQALDVHSYSVQEFMKSNSHSVIDWLIDWLSRRLYHSELIFRENSTIVNVSNEVWPIEGACSLLLLLLLSLLIELGRFWDCIISLDLDALVVWPL